MSSPGSTDTSLADYMRPVLAGSHVTATAFLGSTAAFALGDGTIILANGETTSRINASDTPMYTNYLFHIITRGGKIADLAHANLPLADRGRLPHPWPIRLLTR